MPTRTWESAELVAMLCNLLLKTGVVPEKWKTADMVAGLKRASWGLASMILNSSQW